MSRLISPRDKTVKPRFGSKSSVCLDHCSAQKLDAETVGLVKGSGCFVWLFPGGPVRLLHLSQNQIIGETVFVHMHSFTFPLASFPETLALVVLPLSLKHVLSTNCHSQLLHWVLVGHYREDCKDAHLKVCRCEGTVAPAWRDCTHPYTERSRGQRLIHSP